MRALNSRPKFATAVERWPADGVPPNPGGWLATTANRKALDRIRREAKRGDKQRRAQMRYDDPPEPADVIDDDRLRLIFTCCHPALALEARVALTLRIVGGLTMPEIARAFLVTESAMGQRITRAKAKIKAARIPYRVPSAEDLQVLALYDQLVRLDRSPVVALNRAIAVAEVDGPAAGLAIMDRLEGLAGYYAYHAARADLLRRLGRGEESRAAYDRAIALAANPAEAAYLTHRQDRLA